MGTSGSAPEATREDTRSVFSGLDEPHAPLTTAEVADRLDCTDGAARDNLEALAERGELRTRRIDQSGEVWWRPGGENELGGQQPGLVEHGAFVSAVKDYAIFMLDPDGAVVSWNKGAERIKGYSESEIVGEHFSAFYTDADVEDGVPDHNLEIAAERGRVEDEGWRVRADGTRFWADVVITAVRDDDGELRGFTKVTRDMTEQREYEQQLRRERDLTRQILETAPISIALLTADGEFVRANERALDRLGIEPSRQDDHDVNDWDLYDADGEPIPLDERPWQRAVQTGEQVTDFQCQVDLPEMGRRWLSVNAAPLSGSEQSERVVVTVEDVTDRKERERQLRRERNQTEKLLRTVPVGVTVQNADRETVIANERAQAELGLSEQELREGSFEEGEWEIYDADGAPLPPDEEPAAHVMETGSPVFDEEIIIESPDGERMYVRLNAAPLFDSDGEIDRIVLAGEDITELKEHERELERRKTELETEMGEIFERVSDAFYALDDEWRFTHVNDRAADILGYPPDELLGRSVWEVYPGSEDGVYGERFRTAMETQEPVTFEVHEERPDAWLEFNVYPSETGLSIYFRDVSDRKERERELAESERRYRTLAEYFPNGIVTLFDRDLEYTLAAGKGFESLTLDPSEVEGEHFSEVWDEDTAATMEPLFRGALDGEEQSVELAYEGRDWVVHVVPITDEHGDVFAGMTMAQDITERKERERELAKYETIVETVNDGIYVKDEDGYFTMVNDAYAELTGYDPDDLVGEHASLVVDEAAMRESGKLEATTHGEGVEDPTMEATLRTADGGEVPAEGTFASFQIGEGERKHVGVVRDITERKEQRRRIEESERRYRTLVENFPSGAVGLFDEDLEYSAVGGQLLDDAGIGKEERIGSSVYELYPDEIVAKLEPYFHAALDGEMNSFEVEYHDRHLFAHTLPVRDGNDEVFAGMLVVQDVTERREAERELRESEAKFRMLAENLEEIVWMASSDGEEFIYINPAFESVWGMDRGELYRDSLSFLDAVHPDDRERVREGFTGLPDGEFEEEFRILHPDGELRWVYARGARVRDEDSGMDRVIGVGEDITESKEREQRLEELVDRLEESNERLEQFAYAASHDLQEPLRMVSSYLQLIERRYADELDEDGREFIEFAVDGANRMRDMIEGLLDYSRVDTRGDPFEPLDLNDVLDDARADLQVRIDETDAEITADDLPTVEGDGDQLRQVFQNLLDNAIEYSGDDPPRAHVAAERVGREWHVSVSDEGIGIDPDDSDRVFEVFQSLHATDEHSGTGIGLALCQRIVERHGGDIWVESEPGEGSTFTFTLPADGSRRD